MDSHPAPTACHGSPWLSDTTENDKAWHISRYLPNPADSLQETAAKTPRLPSPLRSPVAGTPPPALIDLMDPPGHAAKAGSLECLATIPESSAQARQRRYSFPESPGAAETSAQAKRKPNGSQPSSLTIESLDQDEEATGTTPLTAVKRRQYRRRPRIDKSAPPKPKNAFELFRNERLPELQRNGVPFGDRSRIIGVQWKELDSEQRQPYRIKACKDKREYLQKMAAYKKTEDYHKYQVYYKSFYEQENERPRPVGRPRKKPRTDGAS
ncbi:hypothetical protein H4R34_004065 [Dimargaris verticillata]|uniref:HMG box domain-containing protein n=1 Tax=Dimargaris verticillata TaxID=2761393 RepID=A0A9W8B515_9FUNG|nr:hypothetical protein H4R34_004065 [Dimargaris verticillata]